jgi:hypothetical protein
VFGPGGESVSFLSAVVVVQTGVATLAPAWLGFVYMGRARKRISRVAGRQTLSRTVTGRSSKTSSPSASQLTTTRPWRVKVF